jgi:tetratricopeptide (TPR) repeat protein
MKAYESLGLALEEIGQEESAVESYNQAVKIAEQAQLNDSSPYYNLSKLLHRQNRFQESLPFLEKALRLNPQSAEIAYTYGKALHQLGREIEAITALVNSTRHAPEWAAPHYLLSRIYLNLRREDEAQKQMQLFQELRSAQSRPGRMDSNQKQMP